MTDKNSKHILIVDDSYDSRILLKTLFESLGYTTDCTANGAEALELLSATSKLPQMILLDLRMPVMDGMTFRELQRVEPRIMNIPVVIMSGDNNTQMLESRAQTLVIQKPLNIPSLMRTIERTIQVH